LNDYSFTSAPQLKRDPLGANSGLLQALTAPYVPAQTASRPKRWGPIAAAVLCWVWGALVAVVSVDNVLDAVRAGRPPSYTWKHGLVAGAFVALYWIAGYGLARRKKVGGVLAIAVSAVFIGLVMIPPEAGAILVAVPNVAILALVLINWRHLERPSDDVGA